MGAMSDMYLQQLRPMKGQVGHPETEAAKDKSTDAPASALPKTHSDQLPLFRTGDAK